MTKVISLSDAAYEEMKSLKHSGDSFSDVVLRLADKERKRPLLDFFGKWPGDSKEAENIKRELEKERSKFKIREAKL